MKWEQVAVIVIVGYLATLFVYPILNGTLGKFLGRTA